MHVLKYEILHLSMPSCKLHHIPCVLQSTWCAASVQHIHIDCVWRPCWTASLSYSLTHCSCVVHVFVLLVCHILWPEVSVTSWWQSCACNCSTFCMCICLGSPHNVGSSLQVLFSRVCTSSGRNKSTDRLISLFAKLTGFSQTTVCNSLFCARVVEMYPPIHR